MMMLTKETKIGLTFGQILAMLALAGGMITTYTDLNVRIAKMEEKNQSFETRLDNSDRMSETLRQENRQDHQRMETKMDLIIDKIGR